MNKTLYSLALGLAGAIGCTTTEYTPKDLTSKLTDGNISLRDSRDFDQAYLSLAKKLATISEEEKPTYLALLSDVDKVRKAYREAVLVNIFPVFDFWAPDCSIRNLNGIEDFSEFSRPINYIDLATVIGAEKANLVFERARERWTSTNGSKAAAQLMYVRVKQEDLKTLFGQYPDVSELIKPLDSKNCEVVPFTIAIGAIESNGVSIQPSWIDALNVLKPTEEKVEEKTEEPKKESQ